MRGLVLLLGVCGCKQLFGLDPPSTGDAGDGDATTVIAVDAQQCWTVAEVGINFCLPAPLSGTATVLGNPSIETNLSGSEPLQCAPTDTTRLCVIAASQITIEDEATLVAVGDRALVLVADTITINGKLDVASHINRPPGPAANGPVCNPGTNPAGRGGGQGGSFGGRGGDGGDQAGAGISGGVAGTPLVTVSELRGGCPGSVGGGATNPGAGGGAVALLAPTIMMSSRAMINASGAAGNAGGADDGGSGAGSGGMIVFHSSSISADPGAQVFANGGGGGGAGDTNSEGHDGTEPTSATVGGMGGQGGDSASGDGGDGFPNDQAARNGSDGGAFSAGGGGGAGGAGIIRVFGGGSLSAAIVSPAPS